MSVVTKRQLNLLQVFMDSNRYLTGQKLSQLLNVSSKTIRNEIKILNQLMNNFALIQSIPSHGYQISIFDDDLFNCWIDKVSKQWSYFIPTNPLERAYYILGLMLESQEFIKIDDISDILFIDRTSVSRSLKYIRERLNDFDLKIVQKTGKGLKIEGEEFRYRLCMAEYIYHKIGMLSTKIGEDHEFIDELRKVIFNDGITMPQRVFQNFIIHIQVQLNRIQRKCYILFHDNEIEKMKMEYEFLVAKDVSKVINKYFHIELSVEEQCYLAIHILGKKSNSTSAIESCINDQLKEEIDIIVEKMLNQVKKVFNIDFHNDMYLRKALGIHINPMENRLKFNTYSRNPLIYVIKENYTLAYILSMEAWLAIYNNADYINVEDEIGYIAIHFQYALERRKRNIAKKRVLLINEYNVAMSELLSFSILKRYKDSLVIEKTISAGELSKYHLESYDYIITTVPLDESLDIPVIRIHPIITTHDFEVLNKYFRQINEYKLSDFLKKEDTYFIDCETKDDVISYIFEHESVSFETFYHTNPLIGFETSLQTVIHYMPIYNQKSSINAYLLSKPIVWKNKLVKIIFVLKLGIDSEQLLQSLQEFFFQKECMDTFLNNMILEEGDEHNKS